MTRRLAVTAIGRPCAGAERARLEARSTPRAQMSWVCRFVAVTVGAIALTFGVAERAAADITASEIVPPVSGCAPQGIAETGDILLVCPGGGYVYTSQTQAFTPVVPPGDSSNTFVNFSDINSAGVVLGYQRPNTTNACTVFLWSRAAGTQTVMTTTTSQYLPAALNDLGEILICYSPTTDGACGTAPDQAYLRRADGTVVPIVVPDQFAIAATTAASLRDLVNAALATL